MQVDHTYDRSFIIKYLSELESLLVSLINRHLTDKSLTRVEQVSMQGSAPFSSSCTLLHWCTSSSCLNCCSYSSRYRYLAVIIVTAVKTIAVVAADILNVAVVAVIIVNYSC